MRSDDRTPRVAIVTSNFWPEETGIGQVTTEFARFIAAQAVDVRVATARPYYPAWQIHPDYRGISGSRTERFGNLVVYRTWHYTRRNPSAVQRIAHELTLSLFGLPNLIRAIHGSDIAFIVSPDLFYAFLGSLVSKMLSVPRVLIVEDLVPDAAVDLGMVRNRWVVRAAQWIAKRTYSMAQQILTLSEGMRERLITLIGSEKEINLLPNTVDFAELVEDTERPNQFRSQFVRDGSFAVVHSGNMGEKQDLNLLLDTASLLRQHDGIHFFVFGDGATKDAFLHRLRALGLTNVSHYPFQSREMFKHILSGADVLLVSQVPEARDIFLPSKLVTALGAGAMVVAACAPESETARLINASQGGVWIPASNASAFANCIIEIKQGKIPTQDYRTRGQAYAKSTFERTTVYSRIVEMIRSYSQSPADG